MEALTTYKTFKQNLDNELNRAAEGFVKIGYLLKLARDNPHILAGSGYTNINEMANKEYGIDKTVVSRWISINDEFSEGGYSDRLKSEYQGYGYSKLAVMLNIPETIREELSPAFTKSEIQTIKDEIDEESHIAPMEVYLEGQAAEQEKIEDNLKRFCISLCMNSRINMLWHSVQRMRRTYRIYSHLRQKLSTPLECRESADFY